MSILNAGSFVGSFAGAGLTKAFGVTSTNFDNLFPLVAVCVASTLLPAPFLGLIPADLERERESERGGSGGAAAPADGAAAAADGGGGDEEEQHGKES
jgi:hypothetical protein